MPTGIPAVTLREDECGPLPWASAALATVQPGAERDGERPKTGDAPVGRPIYSVDQLKASRELRVYLTKCSEEALLGSVMVTLEHKICDVIAMIRDELKVSASAICRGTSSSSLKVPVNRQQYGKTALFYFPSSQHHILVMDVAEE